MTMKKPLAALVAFSLVTAGFGCSPEENEENAQADRTSRAGGGEDQGQREDQGRESQASMSTRSVELPVANGEGALKLARKAPETVRLGEPLHYTIEVTNESEIALEQVVVRDFLPRGFELEKAVPSSMATEKGEKKDEQGRQTAQGDQQAEQGRQTAQEGDQQGQQAEQGRQTAQGDPESQQAEQRRQTAQGDRERQRSREQLTSFRPVGESSRSEPRQETTDRSQPRSASGEQPGVLTWNIGHLEPGQSQTLEVTGFATSGGEAKACLAATYEPQLCTKWKTVEPELRLETEIIAETEGEVLYVCDEIRKRYIIENTGTGTTRPVTLIDPLAEGLVTEDGEQEVRLEIGAVEAGKKVEKTVELRAEQGGEFQSRAIARTDELEVRASQRPLRIVDPQVEIEVQEPQQVTVGSPAEFAVKVTNQSQGPVKELALVFEDVENVERLRFFGDSIQQEEETVRLGTLSAGESRTVYISVVPSAAGELSASFLTKAYCMKEIEKQLTANARGIPALRVETFDLEDPVPVGEETAYEVRIKNQGSAPAKEIQVQAMLPQGLQFVESEGETEVQAEGENLSFGSIRELAPGDTVRWRIRVKAANRGQGQGQFQLQVKSSSAEEPVVENEPTTIQ